MTLTFQLKDSKEVEEFESYMKEIIDYINLSAESIPGTYTIFENTIIVYFTDEFFTYIYKFFIEQLLMGLSGTPKDRNHLETISKYFRQGAECMLMSNIVLDK